MPGQAKLVASPLPPPIRTWQRNLPCPTAKPIPPASTYRSPARTTNYCPEILHLHRDVSRCEQGWVSQLCVQESKEDSSGFDAHVRKVSGLGLWELLGGPGSRTRRCPECQGRTGTLQFLAFRKASTCSGQGLFFAYFQEANRIGWLPDGSARTVPRAISKQAKRARPETPNPTSPKPSQHGVRRACSRQGVDNRLRFGSGLEVIMSWHKASCSFLQALRPSKNSKSPKWGGFW